MSLAPGRTVWRVETAARAAVLVDVADYWAALHAALGAAQHSIHLLGWTFDSRTRLMPGGTAVGEELRARAAAGLDVRVLCWRSALPVAATQEGFPFQDVRTFHGSGVRFVLDGGHPAGACHHQKLVVVDDSLAFCGGADLVQDRWDTAAHLDDDPRRLRGAGRGCFFASRHEVMALVDGPAAAALGDVFRERWRLATGEALSPAAGRSLWPEGLSPNFLAVEAGVARTQPAWRDRREIREAEALTLASIAEARRCIYLENQYFTSPAAAEALAIRLAEADGPEVILISTHASPNWFDRMTMDRARGDFIRRLRPADRHGRLRVLSPHTAHGRPIIVHAKLALIDDDFVRVGSANMNNRSTGFDTECDIAFRLATPAAREAAVTLRRGLIGHWLGRTNAEVATAVRREGGLGRAIDALRTEGAQRLRPIRPAVLGPVASFIAAFHLGDPVGPADSFRPLLRRRRLAAETEGVARQMARFSAPP